MDIMKWEGPRTTDLWDAFDGMRGELDRALDLFRTPESAGLFDREIAPAIDLIEAGDGYEVKADLPGVNKKDLEISIAGTLLTIKGDKKAEVGGEKRKFFRKETWVGSFMRTLNLPSDIDPEKVSAELKDGVLSVKIPKVEAAKPRLVSVSVK